MALFKKKVREEDYRVVEPKQSIEEDDSEEDEVVSEREVGKIKPKVKEVSEEQKVLQVPVFLTERDIGSMVYENNQMLRSIINEIKE